MQILNKIVDWIKNHRRLLIIIVVLIVAVIAAIMIIPTALTTVRENSPVVGLYATCDKSFNTVYDVTLDQISVYLEHENGQFTKISDLENVEMDLSDTVPVGDTAQILLEYETDTVGPYEYELEIEIAREEIVTIKCGYPELDGVTVTLYSNGELCFEGTGDIMTFNEGAMPWMDLDTDVEITSVSFDAFFEPTNMDYWFENLEFLEYCDPIPTSVKTMQKTFSGCIELETQPNWEDCDELLDITMCYENCSALENICDLPESIRKAEGTYQNCTSILETPDMTECLDLTDALSMFDGCSQLSEVYMCPKVEDMSAMFRGCLNLKEMPNIPSTVDNMDSAFSGDVSLETATNIPGNVTNLSNTFNGCQLLEGSLEVDANCDSFNGLFTDAVVATSLDLTGNSLMLDAYANTSNSGNVTVNGEKPNSSINSYSDALNYAEEQAEEEKTAQTQASQQRNASGTTDTETDSVEADESSESKEDVSLSDITKYTDEGITEEEDISVTKEDADQSSNQSTGQSESQSASQNSNQEASQSTKRSDTSEDSTSKSNSIFPSDF